MKPITPVSRVIAFVIDIIIFIVLALAVDAGIVSKIVKSTSEYKTMESEYSLKVKDYQRLQDQYQIYIYDKDNIRIENSNLTEIQKQNFLKNSQVITLRTEITDLTIQKRNYFFMEAVISLAVSYVVYFVILPMCFLGKFTIGKFFFHIVTINKDGEVLKFGKFFFINLLDGIIHVLLGVCTFFLIDVISLIISILNTNKQTISNLITNTYDVVDPSFIEKEGN